MYVNKISETNNWMNYIHWKRFIVGCNFDRCVFYKLTGIGYCYIKINQQ